MRIYVHGSVGLNPFPTTGFVLSATTFCILPDSEKAYTSTPPEDHAGADVLEEYSRRKLNFSRMCLYTAIGIHVLES